MAAFYTALLGSMIVSNSVLAGYKGLCSYLGISKKSSSAFGMGVALTFVCVLSGLISWGLGFALRAIGIYDFMSTIVFILVISSLVQLTELIIKKFFPSLYKTLGIYLPLITTNCVVLGLALQAGGMSDPASFLEVLGTVLGVPLGYFIVIMIFSCIQERLETSNTTYNFKGAAIGLITTAIMALAVYGFSGVI